MKRLSCCAVDADHPSIQKRSFSLRLCAPLNLYFSAGWLKSIINMKNFHPNCTLPSEPSFVSAPNVRGTLSIFWGCLNVLILCTWSIQHPNLPIQLRRQTFWQMFRYQLYLAYWKAGSMLLAILAPEFVAGLAVQEVLLARRFTKKFQALKTTSTAQWTLTHTFFAGMGGYQLHFSRLPPTGPPLSTVPVPTESSRPLGPSHVVLPHPDSSGSKTMNSRAIALQPTITQEKPSTLHIVLPGDMTFPWGDAQSQLNTTSSSSLLCQPSPVNLTGSGQSSEYTTPGVPETSKEILQEEATGWLSTQANIRGIIDPVNLAGKISTRFGQLQWNPAFQIQVKNALELVNMSSDESKTLAQSMLLLQGDVWILDAAQLLKVHEIGLIADLPDTAEEELKDKTRSDVLIKFYAVMQSLWLLVQVISRSSWTNPPIHPSQLEIGTIAIALCMLFIYVAYWYRPQNVSTALVLHASRAPTHHDITIMASERSQIPKDDAAFRVPDLEIMDGYGRYLVASSLVFGALLGTIHFAASNYAFPTPIEAHLWTIAAAMTTGIPIVSVVGVLVVASLAHLFGLNDKHLGSLLLNTYLWGATFAYIVARLFLVVEMFRCFYYLPPNAYVATWASEIPSIS